MFRAPGWCFLPENPARNGCGWRSAFSADCVPPRRACHLRRNATSCVSWNRYPQADLRSGRWSPPRPGYNGWEFPTKWIASGFLATRLARRRSPAFCTSRKLPLRLSYDALLAFRLLADIHPALGSGGCFQLLQGQLDGGAAVACCRSTLYFIRSSASFPVLQSDTGGILALFSVLDGLLGTIADAGHAVGAGFAPDRLTVFQMDVVQGAQFHALAAANTGILCPEGLRFYKKAIEHRVYRAALRRSAQSRPATPGRPHGRYTLRTVRAPGCTPPRPAHSTRWLHRRRSTPAPQLPDRWRGWCRCPAKG